MVNDIFVDQLSVADRGLAFGDGLFETMRYSAGRIPLFEYHLDRLESGCHALAIPVGRTHIEASFKKFATAISDSAPIIVKLIITRGMGGQGCKSPPAQSIRPTIIWQTFPLSDSGHQSLSGVTLQLCDVPIYPNPPLAGIKHLNRLNYVVAALGIPETPMVQGLLIDDKGNVLESLHHNLFMVRGSQLVTPPLTAAGVKGVMRRLILERLAPSCGISTKEQEFRVEDLVTAEEVFLTNSVRGVWPVKFFAAKQWPTPGPVTAKLQGMIDAIFDKGLAGELT